MDKARKATLQDLDQLTVLFEEYRAFYHKESDAEGAESFLKERMEKLESEIFVTEQDGTLTGFVQLYPLFSSTRMKRYLLLNDLFVNENHRGKGYSKALISIAQELCISTGACGILLETDKSNLIGNRLYPSCGFQAYDHANFYEWTNNNI